MLLVVPTTATGHIYEPALKAFGVGTTENEIYNLAGHCGGFWYLHGKAEEVVGFDKALILNAPQKTGPFYPHCIQNDVATEWSPMPYSRMHCNGIMPCLILGVGMGTGYFWTQSERVIKTGDGSMSEPFWEQYGLVVLRGDKEGEEYAATKYEKKSYNL